MVSVTGLDDEPEPLFPPLLPQAAASRAVAATQATSVHRLTALSLPFLPHWSGPPDHWLDEPAVCRCGRPEEVQVTALGCRHYLMSVTPDLASLAGMGIMPHSGMPGTPTGPQPVRISTVSSVTGRSGSSTRRRMSS